MENEPEQRRWRCRDREWTLGRKTLVMGILNVTPDSFSDGGSFLDVPAAVDQAWRIAQEGADLLDVGGVSSRPGSQACSPEEERARIEPVLEKLGDDYPLPISIDTYREPVARAALERGARIVNDITALRGDSKIAPLVSETGAGLILMHMRGTPQTMQQNVEYEDIIAEIQVFLTKQAQYATDCGIASEQIVFDPGVGFGKSVKGNLELIRSAARFTGSGAGVLIGPSRKSFIGKLLDREPQDRIWGTAASVALAIGAGADIIRVHDVAPMVEVCKVADAIARGMVTNAA